MSFGLPSLRPKTCMPESFGFQEGQFGVADNKLIRGLNGVSTNDIITPSHPLEQTEQKYLENQKRLNMNMLRNSQGLHAPLRLGMELRYAERVGRLSFLPSSNIMRDVILGRDTDIDFDDFLNPDEFKEGMVRPHFELK